MRELLIDVREHRRPAHGGGLLVVLLDLSVARQALHRAAELAYPGAAPVTVLAYVRRQMMPAHPLCLVPEFITDEELVEGAREALSAASQEFKLLHGRVDLEVAFSRPEAAAAKLLRERDYALVVARGRNSARQRRQCRRVEQAAGEYCPVDVLPSASRGRSPGSVRQITLRAVRSAVDGNLDL